MDISTLGIAKPKGFAISSSGDAFFVEGDRPYVYRIPDPLEWDGGGTIHVQHRAYYPIAGGVYSLHGGTALTMG